MAHRHMNVEIGTVAAQFPEKEYITGIFLAVCSFKTNLNYYLYRAARFNLSVILVTSIFSLNLKTSWSFSQNKTQQLDTDVSMSHLRMQISVCTTDGLYPDRAMN